jgi:hypothetical protein
MEEGPDSVIFPRRTLVVHEIANLGSVRDWKQWLEGTNTEPRNPVIRHDARPFTISNTPPDPMQ